MSATPSFKNDVLTVVWKELREIRMGQTGRAGRSASLTALIFMGVFGILLPYQNGPEWVTSPLTLLYWSWVPIVLISGIVAQSFAGERERHTLESLLATRLPDRAILFGKIAAVICYGWGLTLGALLLSVITTNVLHGEGRFLFFSADTFIGIVVISLLVALLAAAGGVLLSLRAPTVRQAQQTLSLINMVLIFGGIYGVRSLPLDWEAVLGDALRGGSLPSATVLAVLGGLLVVDALLLQAAISRFRRDRLILD